MKKGFTLVELLAVIVILAVISIITVPIIGNVIEDSKKKALENSVRGLVEAANYFTIENDGVYGFVFNEETKGKTTDGKYSLEYRGSIEAEGNLYINSDGNVSLCLMNEDYYVYKNYNSGIYIGDRSKDSCVAKHDPLTNKYIAYLESEGTGSEVYTKEEVNTLVDNLQSQITSNDTDIENIQNSLKEYALKTELEQTNGQLQSVTDVVSNNTNNITNIQNSLGDYAQKSELNLINNNLSTISNKLDLVTPSALKIEQFNTGDQYTKVIIKMKSVGGFAFLFGRDMYTNPIGFLIGYNYVTNLTSNRTCTAASGTITCDLDIYAVGYILYTSQDVESITYS